MIIQEIELIKFEINVNINLYLRMLSKSVETILSKFVETILSKYLSKNFVKICKKKSGREKNPFSIYR